MELRKVDNYATCVNTGIWKFVHKASFVSPCFAWLVTDYGSVCLCHSRKFPLLAIVELVFLCYAMLCLSFCALALFSPSLPAWHTVERQTEPHETAPRRPEFRHIEDTQSVVRSNLCLYHFIRITPRRHTVL